MSREKILKEMSELLCERRRQISEKEDDQHTRSDWVLLCLSHLGNALNCRHDDAWGDWMLHLGMICLCALESSERSQEPWRRLIPMAEVHANNTRERVFIMRQGPPRIEKGGGHKTPYYVEESVANDWEKANAAYVVSPEPVE